MTHLILLALLAGAPAPEPAESRLDFTVRPNLADVPVAIEPGSGEGVEPGAVAQLEAALAFALRIAPPFRLAAPGEPARQRLRVELERRGGGLAAAVQLTGPGGSRQPTLRVEGTGTPRALGFRIADQLRRMRGAPAIFDARILAVRQGPGRGRELVVLDAGGGDAVVLRRSGGQILAPAWTPDGQAVLFSVIEEKQVIFRQELATGDARRLVSFGDGATEPSLGRDGRLLFTGWSGGNADLYVRDVGGGAPVRLTSAPGIDAFGVWTASGDVLFASDRSGTSRLFQLTPGSTPRPLGGPSGLTCYTPALSPLGDRLAYAATRSGERTRIHLMSVNGGRDRVLPAEEGCDAAEPSFAPWGELLVFSETCRGESHLVVSTPDGSRRERLPGRGLESPAWGPEAAP